MAKIEDLVDEIADPELRERIAHQVKELKETRSFGLVFEEHIPETVSLSGLPIRPGMIVQNRTTPDEPAEFQVLSVGDDKTTVVAKGTTGPESTVHTNDLLVVKRFHEPIFPGLTQVGELRRGPADKPAHIVINGENFHALQVLTYMYAGQVDCIYIDPPYNTGDKSWKYNNRFVDDNDSWKHSKWLSMMEKRLRLAKRLLKPDGVLIVTIDEHEVHHLRMLLEEVYPEAYLQMVTMITNPKGVAQGRFARVEEYALYCFFGSSGVAATRDDLLSDSNTQVNIRSWKGLMRAGTNARPSDGPNLLYPIAIDPARMRVVGAGRSLRDRIDSDEVEELSIDEWRPDPSEDLDGFPVVWPVRNDGSLGLWQAKRETLLALVNEGYVRVSTYKAQWALSYVASGTRKKIESGDIPTAGREPDGGPVIISDFVPKLRAKTVWKRGRHDAGWHGSYMLRQLLGERRFDFPKSLYVVRDSLEPVVSGSPDALVVDFFAGSGTTLHAIALLNSADGGSRRCILVTNNEVSPADADALMAEGYFRGDEEYESQGVFEAVTSPRCVAAITGHRPDGAPVDGKYLDGSSIADGLAENSVFLRMEYLHPDAVELGRQFDAIAPMLWMTAGSVGTWQPWDGTSPWSIPEDSTYGVLFEEDQITGFSAAVDARAGLTHAWLITNSHAAFTEMRAALPDRVEARQLYRDYLHHFTTNAPGRRS